MRRVILVVGAVAVAMLGMLAASPSSSDAAGATVILGRGERGALGFQFTGVFTPSGAVHGQARIEIGGVVTSGRVTCGSVDGSQAVFGGLTRAGVDFVLAVSDEPDGIIFGTGRSDCDTTGFGDPASLPLSSGEIRFVGSGRPSIVVIDDIVGDHDGFGTGLVEGDVLAVGSFDNRDPDDPPFTDMLPASRESAPRFATLSYEHRFDLPPNAVLTAARFSWLTLGVQDGDTQVVGSDVDIRLFIDGAEVAGAFDTVDQFDFFPGTGWSSIVGRVGVDVPSDLLPLLADGLVTVTIETHALGSYAGVDAFAVDSSDLTLEFEGRGCSRTCARPSKSTD